MVASSAKREFLRWIEASGHDTDQLDELPMSLLHEMFPDVAPAGVKWDEIKELTRRILLSPGHVRQFRLKTITNSKGWVTGTPNDPEDAEIYRRMYSELTKCTLGRTASNHNYMRAGLLYLVNDWDEFMHKEERVEALRPFRKLAAAYRIKLS